jgi:hypothetical protein
MFFSKPIEFILNWYIIRLDPMLVLVKGGTQFDEHVRLPKTYPLLL